MSCPHRNAICGTAIVDALAGDPRRVHRHLAPVVDATDRDGQVLALTEAVAWLDRLLDIPASHGLDTATG